MGFYSVDTLINDAQRHGVDVLPPCLKSSEWKTSFEGHSVRLGLHQVRGLGRKSMEQLEATREQGRFDSLQDAVRRMVLSQSAWITLAESGAFDHFVPEGRRAAVWRILYMVQHARNSLALGMPEEPEVQFDRLKPQEMMAANYRTLGLTTGRHPMIHLRKQLSDMGTLTARALETTRNHQWVKVAGVVISRQRPETAKGFMFISLEDETGFINVIVTPRLFESQRALLQAPCLLISGNHVFRSRAYIMSKRGNLRRSISWEASTCLKDITSGRQQPAPMTFALAVHTFLNSELICRPPRMPNSFSLESSHRRLESLARRAVLHPGHTPHQPMFGTLIQAYMHHVLPRSMHVAWWASHRHIGTKVAR